MKKPKEMPIEGDLDALDRKILDVLREDGRISIAELGARIGLSKTPCQIRFRRLVDDGYIEGFRATLNPAKLKLDHIAFSLDERSVPDASVFKWEGAAALKAGGPPLEIPVR